MVSLTLHQARDMGLQVFGILLHAHSVDAGGTIPIHPAKGFLQHVRRQVMDAVNRSRGAAFALSAMRFSPADNRRPCVRPLAWLVWEWSRCSGRSWRDSMARAWINHSVARTTRL